MKWHPWLKSIYLKLLLCFSKINGPKVILLNSKSSIDIITLCYALGRWLMCKNASTFKSCGFCSSCLLMISGNHPDFYQIKSENLNSSIGIDNIRIIYEVVYKCPNQGKSKFICIINSECLTIQAMNSLLRILEEPPEKTYFLIICSDISYILPTIKSRCVCFNFINPDEQYSIYWLKCNLKKKHNILSIKTALKLCNGYPILALELIESSSWQERLCFFNVILKSLENKNSLILFSFLQKVKFNNQLIYWVLTLIHDSLKWKYNIHYLIINMDNTTLISKFSEIFNTKFLFDHWKILMSLFREWNKMSEVNKKICIINYLFFLKKYCVK